MNTRNNVASIVVGQRVHCILYGGKDGIVFNIRGEQTPKTIGTMCGVVSYGGSASYDIVWSDGSEALGIPESVVHGIQWRIHDQIANSAEIALARGYAVIATNAREIAKREKQRLFAADVAEYRTSEQFKHLEQGDDPYSGKLAAKNIRKELRLRFPGMKFSVVKDHYGSVCVRWSHDTDESAVREITNKYRSGDFNGMEDLYEHHTTPWHKVFGGVKYLFTSHRKED